MAFKATISYTVFPPDGSGTLDEEFSALYKDEVELALEIYMLLNTGVTTCDVEVKARHKIQSPILKRLIRDSWW
jgi:hypothetical protein